MNIETGSVVAVVIPTFKSRDHVLGVIERIGLDCHAIYVVDDACPEGSGRHVQEHCKDPRVKLIFNPQNLGVGGAVMAGYRAALNDGCDVIVKIDSDGQMAPELMHLFIRPILEGVADYTKGNRFYDLRHIGKMPGIRLFGNAVLSFLNKFSSGYWDIFDPTNGYTAIHARVAERLPFDKISKTYFFESDMLFRLNTLRCMVLDIPMNAHYANEYSSLRIKSILLEFLSKHIRNFIKRIFYNYFLRDMSIASFELLVGVLMLLFGLVFGLLNWWQSSVYALSTPVGTVMLSAISLILGVQFVLAFLSFDIQSVPKQPVHKRLLKQSYQFDA
jgi:glycosyltransferase involved in cell wall biosynthesis